MKTFTIYEDAGHAWCKVPRKLLVDLGIIEKVSRFSYQRGDFVYLEEDADLDLFCKLKPDAKFKTILSDRSRVQSYRRFTLEKTYIEFLVRGYWYKFKQEATVSEVAEHFDVPVEDVRPKLFSAGQVVSTPLADKYASPLLLKRHLTGDWGELCPEDVEVNENGLLYGDRIMSVYSVGQTKVWVITESDRSVTTFLLPEEY